jgi:hypothetical protein
MRCTRLFPVLALLAVGCAEPDGEGFFMSLDITTTESEAEAGDVLVGVIESADDELVVALPRLTDTFLAEAIIERYEAGIDTRVVTDIDQADDPGVVMLQEAGVPLRLANGAVTYFDFALNQDVAWTSDQTIMSHSYVVADRLDVATASIAGGDTDTAAVVIQMQGEDIAEDLWLEHNQVFGGSDATALTAFSAPAKSQADVRWVYPNETDIPLEMWLGPQERITKRTIDAIYTARSSVRLLSNELVNDGIIRALQDKAGWGFSVEAIVGPEFGTTSQALSRVFQNETPDVDKYRFDDADDMPTLVLIDIEGGPDVMPRAYLLSHDLYSAARLYRNTEVVTDQLIDGNLYVITDDSYSVGDKPDSPLQTLVDLYDDHLNRSGNF